MTSSTIGSLLTPELERALGTCTNLPSLPAVAIRIIDASKDPDITLHEVASIIASDPAISAKLLKIANSSLYSQRRSLNNLREALTLLGFNASLTIALSFSLLQTLGSKNKTNHENYWKRSILAASIARMLASRLNVSRLEDLFLASLLQDIGILVIQCIKESPYAGEQSKDLKHLDRIQLEKEMLKFDHSLIGAWLLESWNLPDYLIKSVLYSHSLNIPDENQSKEDSYFHYCVNLSGTLADIWLDDNPGELLLSVLEVTKRVLDVDNDEFNKLIVEIDESLPEISNMFEMKLVGDREREQVVYEARELLLERSISSIKQSEDARRHIDNIEKSSRLDHLTKVYNRQYIEELLDGEFSEASSNGWSLSLAFIDVDDFKMINDTYGHLIGDEILKSISDFFSNNIRETDILARYGGDEFLLMLPGSTSDIAKSVLERLLDLLRDSITLDVKGIHLTAHVSIGLATHMGLNEFDNLKDFMAAADEALYKAKSKGKDCLAIY